MNRNFLCGKRKDKEKEAIRMERKKRRYLPLKIVVLALFAMGMLIVSYTPAIAADKEQAQALVDRARITFSEFMRDSNYTWLHESLNHAKGVLIFPQVLKGGFIWGGSGGTGVLLVRDEKTGNWTNPAFYTIGSVTFGLQIGGEVSEVVILAMTQKAIDSLLASSIKLGGDVSVALGPVGAGAKANVDVPNVTADFLTFAKSKGLYAGLNLEGAVVAVRDSLNEAYYDRQVRPVDIVVKNMVANSGATGLREALKCKC
jgi:lipid-binding SYLF domain-containing protein